MDTWVHSERLEEAQQCVAFVLIEAQHDLARSPASPPCQRMASSRLRARPSCRNWVCPLTVLVRPMPHSGGVRHSRPLASNSGGGRPGLRPCRAAAGRYRGGSPDWPARLRGIGGGGELWYVAAVAAGAVKQCLAGQYADHQRCAVPVRRGCACRTAPGRGCCRYQARRRRASPGIRPAARCSCCR